MTGNWTGKQEIYLWLASQYVYVFLDNNLPYISGNNVDQQMDETIKGALYYLYSSLPSITSADVLKDQKFYGLSPGGLPNGKQGKDYQGHVFWDMVHQQHFQKFKAYQIFNSRKHGCTLQLLSLGLIWQKLCWSTEFKGLKNQWKGLNLVVITEQGTSIVHHVMTSWNWFFSLRYPWESAYTGAEVTPDICVPCRENQQHITGDIAYAARILLSLDIDYKWLYDPQAGNYSGGQFIIEMAKFWESRPTFNETKGLWEINGRKNIAQQ